MRARLTVLLVTPAPAGSASGNRVTALRWARILRSLGHRVRVAAAYAGHSADVLVALHARKSHDSVARFREARPDAPVIVALTGTDLYADLDTSTAARRSVELATRLVVLQPLGLARLPEPVRAKARSILQSAVPPRDRRVVVPGTFQVLVLAHLRPVKDPLRAAEAARLLPPSSRIVVVHAGEPLDADLAAAARREMETNPRYRWLGGVRRADALRTLAGSELLLITSLMEGGANAASEALACGVPVVSSRIDGSIGILGDDYPGYFPVGDTAALAEMMARAEDPGFRAELAERCARRRPLVEPARERGAWEQLINELVPAAP